MENLGPDIFGRKDTVESTSSMTPLAPGVGPAKIKVIGVGGGGGCAHQCGECTERGKRGTDRGKRGERQGQ